MYTSLVQEKSCKAKSRTDSNSGHIYIKSCHRRSSSAQSNGFTYLKLSFSPQSYLHRVRCLGGWLVPHSTSSNSPPVSNSSPYRKAPHFGIKLLLLYFQVLETEPSDEWPTLNKVQLRSFKKLFGRFDQNKSGGISAHELFQSVKVRYLNEICAKHKLHGATYV